MVRLVKQAAPTKAAEIEACYRTGRVFCANSLVTTLLANDTFQENAGAKELNLDIASLAVQVDSWRPGQQ